MAGTVKNLDEARKRALALGGELVVGGQSFNKIRHRAVTPKHKPPLPPPEAPPAMTREQIENMLDQRVRELDRRWHMRSVEQLATVVEAAGAAMKSVAPIAAPLPAKPRKWRFDVSYDSRGAVSSIMASANMKQWRFDVQYDERGAISSIEASKEG